MLKPISFGRLEVNVISTMDETRGMPEPETPFRVCILGDFSGRVNRGIFETGSALASRRLLAVDRDNFDDVLAKLGVEIHLPIAGNDSSPVAIRFTELDDFHPDRIFEHLEVFQALKETRKKLEDPRTFESAAQPAPVPYISGLRTGSLLDQVLDEAEGRPPETGTLTDSSEWNAFLQRIVKPHLVPDVDPQQAELVAAVDAAIAKLMRTILHHPDFQAIEAA